MVKTSGGLAYVLMFPAIAFSAWYCGIGPSIFATILTLFGATYGMLLPTYSLGLPSLAESERAHIVRVLEAVQWNKKEAARVLDISRGTLYRKIVEYQLEPEGRPGVRRGREDGA